MHVFANNRPDDTEWLPIVDLRFSGTPDLIFAFIAFTMALTVIALLLLAGMRMLRGSIQSAAGLTDGLMAHLGAIATELCSTACGIVSRIPFAWYILTGVTIVPMVLDIPRPLMVWFLLAYCAPGAWISLHCCTPPPTNVCGGRCEGAKSIGQHVHSKLEPTSCGQAHRRLGAPPPPRATPFHSPQLFAGLRIGT